MFKPGGRRPSRIKQILHLQSSLSLESGNRDSHLENAKALYDGSNSILSIRELQDLDMLQAVEVSPQRLVEIINVRAPDESNFADLELSLLIVSWKVPAFRTCSQVKVAE